MSNRKKLVRLQFPPAHEPAPATKAQITAIKKLMAGEASAHQQKLGMRWIIESASRANKPPYIGGVDGERDTAFALGLAFVGQQIIGLINIDTIATGDD